MKALFIAYNQAYGDEIVAILEAHGQRGFTRFDGVGGRGSVSGIPHFNNHAWPEYNDALLVALPDEKVAPLMEELKAKDIETPDLGLRAFSWNIEQVY
ncbi:MAG: hypothetical protein J5771_01540 [Bacteroidales bacterium]|nr:hypothetical protein [Bacteroidales bacterium]